MPQAPIVAYIDSEGRNRIAAPISCNITRTHGTWPNTIVIEVAPQKESIPLTGTLHIEFDGSVLVMPECVVDDTTYQLDTQRQTNTIIMYDRRWKWWFGEISGNYNRRDDSGNLIARKWGDRPILHNPDEDINEWFRSRGDRSPQDLAKMLLDAMGEENYDVSQLPNDDDVRPEIDWDMANPAQELNHLCELLGCRVVLGWNDRVVLHNINTGNELPIDPPGFPLHRIAEAVDAKQRPDKIAVKTSPVVYQMDMQLEAVGLDNDGVVKPIYDMNIFEGMTRPQIRQAFSPDTGWEFDSDDTDVKILADRTCYKWYRIKTPFAFSGVVHEEGGSAVLTFEIDTLDRILPVLDFRASTIIDDGRIKNAPSAVYGKFIDPFTLEDNVTTVVPLQVTTPVDSDLLVPFGYSVDTAKGVVQFSQFVWSGIDYNAWPAVLYYRACFTYRLDTGDRHALLRVREQPEPHLGTKALYVRRPELVPVTVLNYQGKETSFENPEIFTNEETINRIADEYIDELEKQYETTSPAMAEYVGLYPIELDGSIRSVSIRIGADGVFTTANYQQDVGGFGNLAYAQLKRQDQISRIMNDMRGGMLPRGLVKKLRDQM